MTKQKSGIRLFGSGPTLQQTLLQAVHAFQRGQFSQARFLAQQVLVADRNQPDALHLLGTMHLQAREYAAAIEKLRRALNRHPANPSGWNNLGFALRATGDVQGAIDAYRQAIELKPDYADALNNLGNALVAQGDAASAVEVFDRGLVLQPASVATLGNRAVALCQLGRHDEAESGLRAALQTNPGQAQLYARLAEVLHGRGALDAAQRACEAALDLEPDLITALLVKAGIHGTCARWAESMDAFQRVLALAPDHAGALSGWGQVLLKVHRYQEAILACRRAVDHNPADVEAWHGLGQAHQSLKQFPDAIRCLETVLSLAPDYPFGKGELLHLRMLACDWDGIEHGTSDLEADLAQGRKVAEPFGYQAIGCSEAALHQCARIYAASEHPPAFKDLPAIGNAGGRITIGYLCGEFRAQATTMLMAGVYEHHDRSRFRLIGFDAGGADQSDYRQRLEQAFEALIPIKGLSDQEAARRVRQESVDVLVNLNGYFGEERTGVFAHRAAPIQVNYLGFPGTLGADYIDYLIADRVVIPSASRVHYTEKIVWLPHCYQANDRRRSIGPLHLSRMEMGLPPEAVVFASFNNCYKITPAIFERWMRILQRVDGSVLWLMEDNPQTTASLRSRAETSGVAGSRIVTASRMAPADHLARHAMADLFLDTTPYNAHTTASDALWAGLPLLTVRGSTFPGRVAASLLQTIGMPELIAQDLDDYEAKAVELGLDPRRREVLRQRLAVARESSPLFDTALFTGQLERAYEQMVHRHRLGELPDHFSVEATAGPLPAGSGPAVVMDS